MGLVAKDDTVLPRRIISCGSRCPFSDAARRTAHSVGGT